MSGMKKILLIMGIGMMAALAGCAGKDDENAGQAVENTVSEDEISDVEIPEATLSENGISENATSESVGEQDNNAEQTEPEDDGVYFSMEEVKALDIPEDMLAYWLVLNSKIPFASYDEGNQEFYWNEYLWSRGEPYGEHRGDQFIIVDMNNDGKNEILLYCWPESSMVLHYEDGVVYGYQFIFRLMKRIHENGIYEGSSSADTAYFNRLTELSRDGYTEELICYARYSYISDDLSYFEVEGESVSFEEYVEYLQNYIDSSEVAEVYDCTEEMLDAYLLEGVSEDDLYMVKHVAVEPMIDTAEYPMEPEVMQAYYDVLTSEKEFISVTDNNQLFYLNDYHQWNGKYYEDYQVLYFSIVDMDRDGVYEVVLTCSYTTTQILHYENGNVYSYQYDYSHSFLDAIGAIANNGIFSIGNLYYFGPYYDSEYGIITSFGEDGCNMKEVDFNGNINDDRIRYYYFSEELIEKYFR